MTSATSFFGTPVQWKGRQEFAPAAAEAAAAAYLYHKTGEGWWEGRNNPGFDANSAGGTYKLDAKAGFASRIRIDLGPMSECVGFMGPWKPSTDIDLFLVIMCGATDVVVDAGTVCAHSRFTIKAAYHVPGSQVDDIFHRRLTKVGNRSGKNQYAHVDALHPYKVAG